MLALLTLHAEQMGYEVTLGTGYLKPGIGFRKKWSLHRKRLAQDLNVFKDGVYLRKTEELTELGLYWESTGGTWGGRFQDGNHFSLEHEGFK